MDKQKREDEVLTTMSVIFLPDEELEVETTLLAGVAMLIEIASTQKNIKLAIPLNEIHKLADSLLDTLNDVDSLLDDGGMK